MQFPLSLILCFALCHCIGASPFGTITITDETGMTVTSYSARRYAKNIDLQCNYDSDVIDWLITPSNMGVTVWKSGVLRIKTDDLLPKTTFTITAKTEEGDATLPFDIEVTGCEYGSFTALEVSNGGLPILLYRESELVYNGTIVSKTYLCIPHATYRYTTSTIMYSIYFDVSDEEGTQYHVNYIPQRGSGEGSFSIDPTLSPSFEFPSFISVLPNVEKRVLVPIHGGVSNVSVVPHLPFVFKRYVLTVSESTEGVTTYTITATHGDRQVSTTLTVYCGSCPQDTALITVSLEDTTNSYVLPKVDSILPYDNTQSFCVGGNSFDVTYFGVLTVPLVFRRDEYIFYEYMPSRDSNVFHFSVPITQLVTYSSQLSFFVGTPKKNWDEIDFKEKNWKTGSEGKWGSFDASTAYFRAPFSVDDVFKYTFMNVVLRGEGKAEVFVNGNSFSKVVLEASGSNIVVPSSSLVGGNNVVAVALAKGASSSIQFGMAIELTDAPAIRMMEGTASAIQDNPDPKYPPENAFKPSRSSSTSWLATTFPAELIFTYKNTQQAVNRILMSADHQGKFSLQVVGVNGDEKTVLASYNADTVEKMDHDYAFNNLRAFSSYHFVFSSTDNTTSVRLNNIHLYSRALFACPKKYGMKGVVEGVSIAKRCPLGYTGRKMLSCARQETQVGWTEDRSQCYTTNPSKEDQFVDWSFTVRGMTEEAWEEKKELMTALLTEDTYLRASDLSYLYVDFTVEGEDTVMRCFSRCTVQKGMGPVIESGFEKMESQFSELVANKLGKEYTASIDSIKLRNYVNWVLVISLSCTAVVVIVALAVYLSTRAKKGGLKKLEKKGIEQQALLV